MESLNVAKEGGPMDALREHTCKEIEEAEGHLARVLESRHSLASQLEELSRDEEIVRIRIQNLNYALNALNGKVPQQPARDSNPKNASSRRLSAEGREAISRAAKKRWAKYRSSKKKASKRKR